MEAITKLYDQYLKVTGDAGAAATLVLAHVTSAPKTENLTVKQAAAQLGICERSVYQLCMDGRLRHQKIGRRTLIQATDLAEFMADSQREKKSKGVYSCLTL